MKNQPSPKQRLRELVYLIPGTQKLWKRWIEGKRSIYAFNGWGMSTMSNPPWADPADALAQDFLKTHREVAEAVKDGSFKFSQFQNDPNRDKILEELMWRHYVVFWTARHAALSGVADIAECGVCDGLTVYFALSAFGGRGKGWLYDAWEAIPGERLLESEKGHENDYGYLSVADTKKNLSKFDAAFIKGFIPESFATGKKPDSLSWLHVDLNASVPTLDSLNELFPRIVPGGVVLFDDYAWKGFVETKIVIDKFFNDKKGIFLHMPTGQGVFFKK
jgi:hypothetical protein